MTTFIEMVNNVTSRGGFKIFDGVSAQTNTKCSYLMTGQNDVVASGVRDGASAIVSGTEIVELLNSTQNVATMLQELKNMKGSLSRKDVEKLLNKYNI